MKTDLPLLKIRGMRKALGCFDRDLAIRANEFEDSFVIDSAEGDYEIQPSDKPGILAFGNRQVDLTRTIKWLTSISNCDSCRYYFHIHDNIIEELVLFARYDESQLIHDLELFHTNQANEGGANLLGVLDLKRTWIFNVEVDHQGGFEVKFFGSTKRCESLQRWLTSPSHSSDIPHV